MRYVGQWRSLSIAVGSPTDVGAAVADFHAEHAREHNYRRDGALVEIYRVNVRAVGVTPKAELRRYARNGTGLRPVATRHVLFDEVDEPLRTPVYARDALTAGTVVDGPAVIDQLDSTTLVPPGVRAEIDEWLNIRIHVGVA
jgi:N-methylhydantoinase A